MWKGYNIETLDIALYLFYLIICISHLYLPVTWKETPVSLDIEL